MFLPERTQLILDLVVGTGMGSRSSKDIDFIEQSLPRRLSNAGIMRRVGGTIEIEFANSVIDAATARLYPDDRTFDASSDQTARREGGKIIFSIASNKDLPEKFSGVITSRGRSEEHTSELQSLMRISYAVFCLIKKTNNIN